MDKNLIYNAYTFVADSNQFSITIMLLFYTILLHDSGNQF